MQIEMTKKKKKYKQHRICQIGYHIKILIQNFTSEYFLFKYSAA